MRSTKSMERRPMPIQTNSYGMNSGVTTGRGSYGLVPLNRNVARAGPQQYQAAGPKFMSGASSTVNNPA